MWSVLRAEGMHSHHYTPMQGLEEGGPIRRSTFCQFILNACIIGHTTIFRTNLSDIVRDQVLCHNARYPAHYRATVRGFLNYQFPDRRIGRNGPMLWPARAPDFTAVDWSRMKELVHDEEIRS